MHIAASVDTVRRDVESVRVTSAQTESAQVEYGSADASVRLQARRHIVTTRDGVKLAVDEYGDQGADHTVVPLHGLCLTKESWRIQIRQLKREWGNAIRIICFDHRGHGESGCAPMHSYRVDQLADDLADVLAALDVTGAVTLSGHSMGGMTALAYLSRNAADRPVDPQGLVLVATAAGKLAERGLGRLLATPAAATLYALAAHLPRSAADHAVRALARPISGALTRRGGYGRSPNAAMVAMSAGAINATPLTTKAGFLHDLRTYDQYQTLGRITADTTVIGGGADLLTPLQHAHELAAGIPGAKLEQVPTAGHMLLHEAPRLISAAISSCITQAGRLAAV